MQNCNITAYLERGVEMAFNVINKSNLSLLNTTITNNFDWLEKPICVDSSSIVQI